MPDAAAAGVAVCGELGDVDAGAGAVVPCVVDDLDELGAAVGEHAPDELAGTLGEVDHGPQYATSVDVAQQLARRQHVDSRLRLLDDPEGGDHRGLLDTQGEPTQGPVWPKRA